MLDNVRVFNYKSSTDSDKDLTFAKYMLEAGNLCVCPSWRALAIDRFGKDVVNEYDFGIGTECRMLGEKFSRSYLSQSKMMELEISPSKVRCIVLLRQCHSRLSAFTSLALFVMRVILVKSRYYFKINANV